MEIQKIGQNLSGHLSSKSNSINRVGVSGNTISDQVSFQGIAAKRAWLGMRRLANGMNNISEMMNAVIAAIGTGIIAPLIILVSPGKGDQEDKDKKFFQAIRQPLSAGLQLGFQVPATYYVNKGLNNLAYTKDVHIFDDPVLGRLIPDKKYLKKQIKSSELQEWENRFEEVVDGKSLKQKLEDKIRKEYEEVKLSVSEDKLTKEVNKQKKEFLLDEIAEKKHNDAIMRKVEELRTKGLKIENIDLVNDDYKRLAEQRNKEAYKQLDKEFSLFDRILDTLGFEPKKLKDARDNFKTQKGLEILEAEEKELLKDNNAKLERYIRTLEEKSKDLFKHRKFLISLGVNLFMVTLSCYALNWAHPRLKALIDKHRAKSTQDQQENKKVEVNA